MRKFVADAEALEHVAWLKARAGAGRTRRACDVLDTHQQRLAFDVAEADVEDVRETALCVAVHLNDFESRRKFALEFAAQTKQTLAFGFHLMHRELACFAEADDAGDVQRARAHAALVTAAVLDRFQSDARIATSHVQRANALRAVHLVARP